MLGIPPRGFVEFKRALAVLELETCRFGQLAPGGVPRDILRPCDLARLIHGQREPVLGEILSLV